MLGLGSASLDRGVVDQICGGNTVTPVWERRASTGIRHSLYIKGHWSGVPASPNLLWPNTYAHTLWPRSTKFGMVTCGEERISRGQPRPVPRGRGPASPNFRTSCAHKETTTKFCMVMKLLYGRPWMLTRDLFAVDTLFYSAADSFAVARVDLIRIACIVRMHPFSSHTWPSIHQTRDCIDCRSLCLCRSESWMLRRDIIPHGIRYRLINSILYSLTRGISARILCTKSVCD